MVARSRTCHKMIHILVWYDEEWKRIFGGRGDEAGSGRVLELRRGGWDVLVG